MIRCPGTGREISTGIEIEQATFDQLPIVPSGLNCPACVGYHAWTKNQAWLSDADAASTSGETTTCGAKPARPA